LNTEIGFLTGKLGQIRRAALVKALEKPESRRGPPKRNGEHYGQMTRKTSGRMKGEGLQIRGTIGVEP